MQLVRRVLNDLLEEVVCKSRAIACVIVHSNDSGWSIIGEGTNNPDPTMDCVDYAKLLGHSFTDDGQCPRRTLGFKSGEGLELCRAQHAERESILSAGNVDLTGTRMFMTCECPCADCATAIVNAGISEIFILDKPDYDPRGREILDEGGVTISTWNPTRPTPSVRVNRDGSASIVGECVGMGF